MSTSVFVTAATSQLGSHVVEELLPDVKNGSVKLTVSARDAKKVPAEWTSAGVEVKTIDYTQSGDAWAKALQGVDRVLLISSNSGIGAERVQQHKNVIDGAKTAGVKVLAYTSIVNSDTYAIQLGADHKATEADVKASGVPYVLLRNGWYVENWLQAKDAWKHTGVLASAAGEAKFSAAPRVDYAVAAANVLRPAHTNTNAVYELGGPAFTLEAFAAEISSILGSPVKHVSLPPADFEQLLVTKAGLPQAFASLLVDADVQAQKGALYTERDDLATLLGRPAGSWKAVLRQALSS